MTKTTRIEWHPAFCSAMQLELRDYAEHLQYINEYNLNSKPLQIDLLIIKMNHPILIRNEIGRIFRKHNIIEYKSPKDSMNEDVFLKTVGYGCIYKASEKHVGEIPIEEVSLTLIRSRFPRKLFQWLSRHSCTIIEKYDGIYYVENVLGFAVQIIVTSKLSGEAQMWLTLLNDNLTKSDVKRAIRQSNALVTKGEKEAADSVFQVAVSGNREMFDIVKREGEVMCKALLELMEPEITEAKNQAMREGHAEGHAEGLAAGRAAGIAEGRAEGERAFATLVGMLLKEGLTDILERITVDTELRESYYLKYGIR